MHKRVIVVTLSVSQSVSQKCQGYSVPLLLLTYPGVTFSRQLLNPNHHKRVQNDRMGLVPSLAPVYTPLEEVL